MESQNNFSLNNIDQNQQIQAPNQTKLQQTQIQNQNSNQKEHLIDVEKQNIQKNKKINKHKKKKEDQIIYKNLNPFKEQQKHFKLYQDRQTDWSYLYDPQNSEKIEIDGCTIYNLPAPQNGSYLIKGFNSAQVVNHIGYLALNQFWKKPYRTNLNSRNQLYEQKDQSQKNPTQQSQIVKQKHQPQQYLEQATQQQFKNQVNEKGYCFNDKIRWANVGHQYDWTLRKYPQFHTPMHQNIKELTDRANIIFNKISKQEKQYHPQSAIVNYYGIKDYMTGHLDDAEYDQVSPIYSFSFGLSCVFLMGGMTKDQKPTAVRLDSGDLLIMSKNSRKCYHGVPRVIAQSYKLQQFQNKVQKVPNNANSPQKVQKYYQNHRININIRQVFPEPIKNQ